MADANHIAPEDSDTLYLCGTCGDEKPASGFYLRNGRLRRPCKKCISAQAEAWKTANPERALAIRKAADARQRIKQGMIPRANLPGERGVLTQERLKKILSYDPRTGVFNYRIARSNVKAGDVAGSPNEDGYILISIDEKKYRAHRLAWLYMTGAWPERDIDHRNLIPGDNHWENLREATDQQNLQNQSIPRHNTSGLKGASWRADKQKWRSCICSNGQWQHLGYFDTKEEAHIAYCAAALELNGEFANFG
ncbi:HNH endonuclease [Burkholderia vietnamiensis]|uniref:HNH endonuclease n=1 Tax=Burkholderia vietnamiensis TaxID=60552 RepID=UPI00264F5EB6|nr:HNH endonuclease [Burkholderia vietnamiensis]MDN7411671.1 HNH endonuclease [Burkholderia vietnamiensis]